MEGMGLKFTPVMRRRLLRHSSTFVPMAGTSGTHRWPKKSQWKVTVILKKVGENPAV